MGDCSNNGACLLYDVEDAVVQSCPVVSFSCYAKCKCFDGWNGTSCTVPEAHTHPFDLVCGTLVPRPRLERRAVRGASLPGQLLEPRPERVGWEVAACEQPTCHPVCEHGTCTRHGERASGACFEGWQGVRCDEPSLPIELSSAWSVHGARMCLLEPVFMIPHDIS